MIAETKKADLAADYSELAKNGKENLVTSAKFKKPNSDYFRLDLVQRGQEHGQMVEDIKADYKSYLQIMSGIQGISITRYIQRLIEEDMSKNAEKYEQLSKLK